MRRSIPTLLCAVGALLITSRPASGQTAPPPPLQRTTMADSVVFLRITPSPRAAALSQERLDSLHRVLKEMEDAPVGSSAWTEMKSRVTTLLNSLSEQTATGVRMIAPLDPSDLPGLARMVRADPLPIPRGWIGLSLDGPHDVMLTSDGEAVHYFEHPLVVSVDPNSPADRSGISSGDTLMAYDGADVRQSWINMTRLLQPDRKITVSIKREGQTKNFRVTVDSAPLGFVRRLAVPLPAPNLGYRFTPVPPGALLPTLAATNALFGATMSDVTPELGAALSISAGVLVNAAPPESPAYKAGLRAGDVVTSAGGTRVTSVSQFRRAVVEHAEEHELTVDVRRKGKARRLTLRW